MKKALLTTNIAEAMTFTSFGAANAAGDEYLGEGQFRCDGKGGIRVATANPAVKITHYIRELVAA